MIERALTRRERFREEARDRSRVVAEHAAAPRAEHDVSIARALHHVEHARDAAGHHALDLRAAARVALEHDLRVHGCAREERARPRTLEQRSLVVAQHGHTRRVDRPVRVHRIARRGVERVHRVALEAREERGAPRERLLLRTRPGEEASTRVVCGGEVERAHGTVLIEESSRRGERGLTRHLDRDPFARLPRRALQHLVEAERTRSVLAEAHVVGDLHARAGRRRVVPRGEDADDLLAQAGGGLAVDGHDVLRVCGGSSMHDASKVAS